MCEQWTAQAEWVQILQHMFIHLYYVASHKLYTSSMQVMLQPPNILGFCIIVMLYKVPVILQELFTGIF